MNAPAKKPYFTKWTAEQRVNMAKAMARESVPPMTKYAVKKWLENNQVPYVGAAMVRSSFAQKELDEFLVAIKSFIDTVKNRPALAGGGLVAVPKKEDNQLPLKLTPRQEAEAAFSSALEEVYPSTEPKIEAIPPFIWWDEHLRNFCEVHKTDSSLMKGLPVDFFDIWFARRKEFPQSRKEAFPEIQKPDPVVTPIDSSLKDKINALSIKLDDSVQTMLSAQRRQHQEFIKFMQTKEASFEKMFSLVETALASQAKSLEDLTLHVMLQNDVIQELGIVVHKNKDQSEQPEKKTTEMAPKPLRRRVTVVGCIPKYRDELERKNQGWKITWIDSGDFQGDIKNKTSGRIVVLVNLFQPSKDTVTMVKNTAAHFVQVNTPNAITEALKTIPESINGGIES